MGTISKGAAKRRNKETAGQKRRRLRISNTMNRKNLGRDELNVMK